MKSETELARAWVVASFNETTLYGVVQRDGVCHPFHSTSFQADSSHRWPVVGEHVEIVFNNAGRLLSVHGT